MPRRPSAASFGTSSVGKCWVSSHSITWGRISVSANSRMLRRRRSCSSLRRKSINHRTLALLTRPPRGAGASGWPLYRARRRRRLRGRRLRRPIGVGRLILHEPPVEQAGVRLPPHPVPLVERRQFALQRREPIEGDTREIVVLEMIVGIEKRKVPEPVAAHQRAPLGGIGGIDVVVLA